MPIPTRGLLTLGSYYRVEVVPLASLARIRMIGIPGVNPCDQLAPEGIGAVVFICMETQPAASHTAWLFDCAGFRVGATGDFAWHLSDCATAPAQFIRRDGIFFVDNLATPTALLEADGSPIAPGEAVPLRTGQSLRIGNVTFDVSVS